MHKRSLSFLLLISAIFLISCDNDSSGKSSLSEVEQEALDLVNYARMDPQGFAQEYLLTLYNAGTDNGAYEDLMGRDPVGALEIHDGLLNAAYAHSTDMATNCQTMQHDSCDGTSPWDRIGAYYDGGTLAENVAWGFSSGEQVVLAWIIDNGIPSLGHRINILNGAYEHMGIAEVDTYWTQDFGAGGK